jgi:hypothetical protein
MAFAIENLLYTYAYANHMTVVISKRRELNNAHDSLGYVVTPAPSTFTIQWYLPTNGYTENV